MGAIKHSLGGTSGIPSQLMGEILSPLKPTPPILTLLGTHLDDYLCLDLFDDHPYISASRQQRNIVHQCTTIFEKDGTQGYQI